jgi:hypothetical protein
LLRIDECAKGVEVERAVSARLFYGRVDDPAVAGELDRSALAGVAGGHEGAAVRERPRDGGDLPDAQARAAWEQGADPKR